MSDRADPFEWSGGHPALDFVNTLDERPFEQPIENLATYRDLVRFAELAKLIEPSVAAPLRTLSRTRVLTRCQARPRAARASARRYLRRAHKRRPVSQSDLDAIAAAIQAAHAARALGRPTSTSLASHRWSRPMDVATPLHACALAIESLLMEVDRGRIRKCAATDCGVYFVDTSKGHRRQWCSMGNCGNREKQRRWRSGAR